VSPARKARGARRAKVRATGAKGLLRGRFEGGVHPALDRINRSLPVDRRLWREDVTASIAHARMLGERRILPRAVAARLVAGLKRVAKEFEAGTFRERPEDEDVHMAVERRLTELVGPDGGRLHTGRSRNDQVAADLALHLVRLGERCRDRVPRVQRALVRLARRDGDAILPAYTHLQRAQPVLLGHHLLAYVEMLERDRGRLGVVLLGGGWPLGAGAGTGSAYPVSPLRSARLAGLEWPDDVPLSNSLDAVSSRDVLTEWVAAAAIAAVTLSRLGEDLVLWTTREFGFARLGDAVSTGSSIMPQKRNPDGAELLRGKCARVVGALTALLTLQKALPLGYSKDLQEDKAILFEVEDALFAMLDVADAMLEDVRFDRARMRAAVDDPAGHVLATEAADWLAKRGVPFREAHRAVGALVREADRRGVGLRDLPPSVFRTAHPAFDPTVVRALTPEAAVSARRAPGGTAPRNVLREIERWEAALGLRREGRAAGGRKSRVQRRPRAR
jgi:argininosuccinate lyase